MRYTAYVSVLVVGCLVMGVTPPVRASQAEHAVWRSFKISCDRCGEAGEVSVEASVQDGTYRVLKITAFGREHVLSASDLSKLRGFPLSSVAVMHEPGYPDVGGYTVTLQLTRLLHDTSGKVVYEHGKMVYEHACVCVCKNEPGQTTVSKSQSEMD